MAMMMNETNGMKNDALTLLSVMKPRLKLSWSMMVPMAKGINAPPTIAKTSPAEQRSTEWMTYESLTDFLDPANNDLTIEGYPAPQRAIFIAEID